MSRRSLRVRVTAVALGVLAVALVAVGAFVFLALRSSLERELDRRLTDRAQLAQRLATRMPAQALADRLSTQNTLAAVETSGGLVRGVPAPPLPAGRGPRGFARRLARRRAAARGTPAPPVTTGSTGRITRDGDVLRLQSTLPTGASLLLSVSRADAAGTLSRLIGLELGASLLALAVAGLGLWRGLGRALQPLDDVRGVALGIARGRTGDRLRPRGTDTELDRLGVAFDEMLDAQDAALEQSRTAEARMRTFLADASHELRSPIAGIQATGETLLRDGEDRARRERLAVTVVRESRRAGRLVSDLLAATRAESVALRRAPVELDALVRDVVGRRPAVGPGRRTSVDPQSSDGSRHRVQADADRLEQVLTILLDNAERAAAEVRVSVGPTSVTVDDDGPGISADDRERVFERFVRLDAARDRRDGGSGLGLAIARGIATAHGGTLTCAASPLGGARFRLDLGDDALGDLDRVVGGGDAGVDGHVEEDLDDLGRGQSVVEGAADVDRDLPVAAERR